jgi:virginiamycin B lyase
LLVGVGILIVLAVVAAVWKWSGRTSAQFVEYPMLEAHDGPTAIAAAPDGSVWFTIDFANAIGRVRDGKLERFAEEKTNGEPVGIAAAADGSAWYTDAPAGQITHVSATGELTSIPLDTPLTRIGQLALAPDGALWFTEASAYSVTRWHEGRFERHVIDALRGAAQGIAVGKDGVVWATLQAANQLLRIAPDGSMQMFDIPTRGSSPGDITVAADGSVWFLEFRGNKIGRFADGRFEEFPVGEESAGLTGLDVAPDGAVWVGMLRKGSLGRLKDGKLQEFRLPRQDARPYGVAVDREGNVWYTDIRGFVGMLNR